MNPNHSSQLESALVKLRDDEDIFAELVASNIFIIGGVASGKSELVQTLQKELPHISVDVGKLFRLVAYLILTDIDEPINPNLTLLQLNDNAERERVIHSLYRKTRYLEGNVLGGATFRHRDDGTLKFEFFGRDLGTSLEGDIINTLVSTVAKSPKVRELIWRWINKFAAENGGLLITGHNLRETDTTMYRVIHLTVDNDIAAARLQQRSPEYTEGTAKQAVITRNEQDHFGQTEQILNRVNGLIQIETDDLTTAEVAEAALLGLESRLRRESYIRKSLEQNAIERNSFEWVFNPVMQVIRERLEKKVSEIKIPDSISAFDLLMQCLLHLPAFDIVELFPTIEPTLRQILLDAIANRDGSELLVEQLRAVDINDELLNKVISIQIQRLLGLSDLRLSSLVSRASVLAPVLETQIISKDNSRYIDGEMCRHLVIKLGSTGSTLTLRPTNPEISQLYARSLHYLHSERHDEFMGFGAYMDESPYPIAWVSYSMHDRPYKTELLHHLGIEPHNVLEMTRAWNANFAPKNMMSTLFAYANEELRRIWDTMVSEYKADKPLLGITTTINPNLGFSGRSFSGASFSVFSLRPATLNYVFEGKTPMYTTRRALTQNNVAVDQAVSAKVSQLPLNEMIMLYNGKRNEEVSLGKVYRIDPNIYEEI